MSMRGVEKQNSVAVTSAMAGVFRDNARTRMEFLELVKLSGAALNLREGLHSPMAGVLEE
jgi:GTP cyclohydrolase I